MISRLPGENLKKSYLNYFSYCLLQNWALKSGIQDISKIAIASSFKRGQLIEDNE